MAIERRNAENVDVTDVGLTLGAVVGGSDAMKTSDGDTSYAEVTGATFVAMTGHTFTWSGAGPIPPDATVTIEADWFTPDAGGFSVSFVHPTYGGITAAAFGFDGLTRAYGDIETHPVSSSWVEDGAAFLPGVVWLFRSLDPGEGFITIHARVTRLTLVIETTGGPEPLRLRQRGDGLGLGAPRVRVTGSRQTSPRVRGLL